MKTTLAAMTGAQLLTILKEHEKRRDEGYPLMMPTKDEEGNAQRVYINPRNTLLEVERMSEKAKGEDSQQQPPESSNYETPV